MCDDQSTEAVVIGCSAGGVEALQIVLRALPDDFALAVAIVLHIPAGNGSLLVQVLQPYCSRPLREAEDKEVIEAGTVYVAPPGYHLLVEPARSFALSVDEPVHFARPAIDLLFESAALAYGPALLGVLMTGANQDGARGLATIRSRGGRAWVQDPSSAVASTMPCSAIEIAGADRIMPLAQIAQALAELGRPQ
jgi:two-component system chemotaxis response regulator CheB